MGMSYLENSVYPVPNFNVALDIGVWYSGFIVRKEARNACQMAVGNN
jgi:hypothetical protein